MKKVHQLLLTSSLVMVKSTRAEDCDEWSTINPIDGSCELCPLYTRRQRDNTCAHDACDFRMEVKTLYGTCQTCAPCYIPDPARMPQPDQCAVGGDWLAGSCDHIVITGIPVTPFGTPATTYAPSHPPVAQVQTPGPVPMTWQPSPTAFIENTGSKGKRNNAPISSPFAAPASCPMCEEQNSTSLICEKVPFYNDCMYTYCDWSSQFLMNLTCQDCPMCQQPSFDKQFCIQGDNYGTCLDQACDWEINIIQNDQCKECPKCHVSNWERTSCVQVPEFQSCMLEACSWDKQILDNYGFCEDCPVCTEPDVLKTKCNQVRNYDFCMTQACDWNSQVINNNVCEDCPPCQRPDFWRSQCYKDQDYDQCMILQTQPVTLPIAQPIVQPIAQPIVQPIAQPIAQPIVQPIAQPVAQPIVQPIAQPVAQPVAQPIAQPLAQPVVLACGDTEYRSPQGLCTVCPPQTQPNDNHTTCVTVPQNEDLSAVKVQESAPDKQQAQTPVEQPQELGQQWQASPILIPTPTCAGNEALMTSLNLCLPCPAGTGPNMDHTSCEKMIDIECSSNEILSLDRECLPCPEGSEPDTTASYCQSIVTQIQGSKCNSNQFVNSQYECVECPAGFTADSQQHGCILQLQTTPQVPNCSPTQWVNPQYQCVQCPPGQFSDPEQHYCISPASATTPIQSDLVKCPPTHYWEEQFQTCFPYTGQSYNYSTGNQEASHGPGSMGMSSTYGVAFAGIQGAHEQILTNTQRQCAMHEIMFQGRCLPCPPSSSPDAKQQYCM